MKKITGVTATQAMAGNGAASAKATPKKGKAVKKEVGSGTNVSPLRVTKRTPKKTKVPIKVLDEEEDEIEDENGEVKEEFIDAEEELDA